MSSAPASRRPPSPTGSVRGARGARLRARLRASVRASVASCGIALGLLAALGASACGEAAERGPTRRPSLLFISLDTLRRDAVFDGATPSPDIAPALAAFAADAVSFEGARVQVPFTLPSHMSMFTGLYPDVHGVTGRRRVLPEAVRSLPEILQAAGYATAGYVTNTWMKGGFGFARGFDSYERLPRDLTYADRVRARAEGDLGLFEDPERPGFLFLHFLDAHSDENRFGNTGLPYYAPDAYRSAEHAADLFCDARGRCATEFLVEADREGAPVDAETIAAARVAYDDGVRYLDAEFGRLMEALKTRGLYDELLIVVTSDHGEEFREHGAFIHSQTYDETIAVPLLVKLPGQRHGGRSVTGLAETVDLLPTLLELLELPAQPGVQGTSLADAIERGVSPKVWALSQDKGRRTRYALLAEGHKLIHDVQDGHSELYDLAADPGEQDDLAAADPERVARLTARLRSVLDAHQERRAALDAPVGDGAVLTDEEIAELQGIGYLR